MPSLRRNGFLVVWERRFSIGAVVYRKVGNSYQYTKPGRFRTRRQAYDWCDSQPSAENAQPTLAAQPATVAPAPQPGTGAGTPALSA